MQAKILVVDDDEDILVGLTSRLSWMGHDVLTAETGEQALKMVREDRPDLLLLDIEMSGINGLEVMKQLREFQSEGSALLMGPSAITCKPAIIVLTAFGTIDRAVEAMRLGAFDFLTKPFAVDHLAVVVGKALAYLSLQQRVDRLSAEVDGRYDPIVGKGQRWHTCLDMARQAARADASVTVLLLGETGTGKEVVARAIHRWSDRSNKPFMAINCTNFTEALLENELFGHEKGAYTGATSREFGKIEAADGGTVFLDEIGDLPLGLQARLLRLLQEREFFRVGGTKPVKVDVRFVAATNKDIDEAVAQGTFRQDLLYRLDVIRVSLPPLRERMEDLEDLAFHFLQRGLRPNTSQQIQLSDEALAAMRAYHWPGNIRELENVMVRARVLCQGDLIKPEHLGLSGKQWHSVGKDQPVMINLNYYTSLNQHSRALIEEALRRVGWNQTKAAEVLGVHRTYLTKLLRTYGMSGKPPQI